MLSCNRSHFSLIICPASSGRSQHHPSSQGDTVTKPNVHAVHRDWTEEFPGHRTYSGIYLYDESGRRYIDGSGVSSVVTSTAMGCLKFRKPCTTRRRSSPLPRTCLYQPALPRPFRPDRSLAPGELRDNSRVWITCTGTDATDDAVRLARRVLGRASHRPPSTRSSRAGRHFTATTLPWPVSPVSPLAARFSSRCTSTRHTSPPGVLRYRCYFSTRAAPSATSFAPALNS